VVVLRSGPDVVSFRRDNSTIAQTVTLAEWSALSPERVS
jgi:hypothetical protein